MAEGIRIRQIVLNAFTSVSQVLVVGGSFFFLYRYLVKTIGVEQLGIWSVVLATSSVASVAKKGISGSAIKYVAKYLARGEEKTVSRVLQTTFLSIGVFSGAALCITYPAVKWLLTLFIPAEKVGLAHGILPYAVLSVWLMILASVYYAGLDGYQRTDLRSWALMAGAVLLLILAYLLVPDLGLMGLAYAQVAQSLFILLASWVLLKTRLRILPFFPRAWDRALFREMVGYGLNLQAINLLQTFYDPLTKALLTKFGNLGMTGYYEMASRMVMQLRTLIVAANQVMVPTIADLHEKGSGLLRRVYSRSYQLVLYVSLPFFSAIALLTPAISHLWIGHHERTFIVFTHLLTLGWFIDTLISPSYFSNLGTGDVKWNTMGHSLVAVLNAVLCLALGSLFGGTGVVLGWVISLDAGSLFISFTYHRRHDIPLVELLPRGHAGIALASLAGLAAAFAAYRLLSVNIWTVTAAMSTIYASFVFFPLWVHPMREKLMEWILEALARNREAGLDAGLSSGR